MTEPSTAIAERSNRHPHNRYSHRDKRAAHNPDQTIEPEVRFRQGDEFELLQYYYERKKAVSLKGAPGCGKSKLAVFIDETDSLTASVQRCFNALLYDQRRLTVFGDVVLNHTFGRRRWSTLSRLDFSRLRRVFQRLLKIKCHNLRRNSLLSLKKAQSAGTNRLLAGILPRSSTQRVAMLCVHTTLEQKFCQFQQSSFGDRKNSLELLPTIQSAPVELSKALLAKRCEPEADKNENQGDERPESTAEQEEHAAREFAAANPGLCSMVAVADALAARVAPDISPPTCPPAERVRTHQSNCRGFPVMKTLGDYNRFLAFVSKVSQLSRAVEFAWVCACQVISEARLGTDPKQAAKAKQDRGYAFGRLMGYFGPLVEVKLVTHLKARLGAAADLDTAEIVNRAWLSFYRAFLAATETFPADKQANRDRYSGVASLRAFLFGIALKRLPKLGFRLTADGLDSVRRVGCEATTLEQVFCLIDQFFPDKDAYLKALEKNLTKEQLAETRELFLLYARRERRPEKPLPSAAANDDPREKPPPLNPDECPAKTDSLIKLCAAILNNKLPDRQHLRDVVPQPLLTRWIIAGKLDFQHRQHSKWSQLPLTDVQKARASAYYIFNRAAGDIAGDVAAHLTLSEATRKFRCCLTGFLDRALLEQWNVAWKRYEFLNTNLDAARTEQRLPGGGFLEIRLPEQVIHTLCPDELAFDYHYNAYTLTELGKKEVNKKRFPTVAGGPDRTELIYAELEKQWLQMFPRLQSIVANILEGK